MYTIILYSTVVTIPLTLSFFSKRVLGACIFYGTIPHIRCKIPSSLPPVFGTCKIFQFCLFCSAVFCLQSCMGRVSYLLPPNIWVDVFSLPTVWRVGIQDSALNKDQLHRPTQKAHNHIHFDQKLACMRHVQWLAMDLASDRPVWETPSFSLGFSWGMSSLRS